MSIDNKRILLFAHIANFTYNDPDKARLDFLNLGYDIVKFLDHKGSQAYIIENDLEIIISFRGTQLTQKSDIIADMKIIKEKDVCGNVHRGFKGELDKIWNELLLVINDSIKPLFITGHSLGAGMGIIAASRLGKKVSEMITFGSPRVGDNEFVDNLDVIHYRIRNTSDIITKIPLESLNYKHHGKCIYLNYYGVVCELTYFQMFVDFFRSRFYTLYKLQFFNGIHDHSMSNYIDKLNKLN